MSKVMTAEKFVDMAIDIAKNYKTLYIMGCFGAPMTSANKARYRTNCAYNKQPARTQMINAASSDTFGFDCVNLIKGILWGWNCDKSAVYGGARYASNGVPDVSADQIMKYCTDVSTSFKDLKIGEILHLSGHVGIYIGNGLAVECTPKWTNNVQFSAVANIGGKSGYNSRTWSNHGKLSFIDYSSAAKPDPVEEVTPEKPKTEKEGGYMFEVKTVKKGSKGSDVLLCQKLLLADGYKGKDGKNLVLDGSCGDNTVAAINKFQTAMRKKGIECGTNGKNDGCCGAKCWKALLDV